MSLEKLYKALGITEQFLAPLTAEEPPQDFDADSHIENFLNSRKAVWLKKLEPEFEEAKKGEFLTYNKRVAKDVAKALGIDGTKTKIAEIGLKGVMELIPTRLQEITDAASKITDEQAAAKITEWQSKHAGLVKDLDNLKVQHAKDLTRLENEKQQALDNIEINKAFRKEFDNLTYGIPPGMVRLFEKEARETITKKWKVSTDGKITDKSGQGMAVSFDGNTTYETIAEPIAHLAREHEVLKKSNKKPGDKDEYTPPKNAPDNSSELHRRMIDARRRTAR